MNTLLKLASLPVVLAIASSVAVAQAINLDIGRANSEPSLAYGAGAGQPGVWNRLVVTAGGPLVDTAGNPTGATVSTVVQHHFNFLFNNPLTTGDDELLLDAGHDGAVTIDFQGLINGDYVVTTYAFAPDNPVNYFTNVDVPGSSDAVQAVGGAQWSGTHLQGRTFARHRVTVTNGSLQIVCTVGALYATVNGVQIEPTRPAPVTYCTAKVNSLGCVPALSSVGTPSASAASGFVLNTVNVINNKPGLYIYTDCGQAAVPLSGGVRCVNGPLKRTVVLASGGNPPPDDCSGIYSLDMNAFTVGALGGFPAYYLGVPGAIVNVQAWGRDSGFPAPNNATLSNGLKYTVGP